MFNKKKKENTEKKFIITANQIQELCMALGEMPAKFSFNSLQMLDTLPEFGKQNDKLG